MEKCRNKDCKEKAVSLSEFCYKHIEDKDAYRKNLLEHIRKNNSIKDFYLRYVEMPQFDFIDIDCSNADFAFANLEGANFHGARMGHSNLSHANLRSAYFDNADLSESYLLGCDLSGARLWHADLKGTNLVETNLSGADLLGANFSLVKFWNVNLQGAKLLTKHNFLVGKSIFSNRYALDEKGAIAAADGYRILKQYFMSTGRYDDASWAAFKEKQSERRQLLKDGNIAYIPSLIMAFTCGYGERPQRIIIFSIAVILTYAILYYLTDAIGPLKIPRPITFWDCLYFSTVAFTTVGFGDITVKLKPFFEMLVATQAFLGVFVMGLFVYTLTRKYSAR